MRGVGRTTGRVISIHALREEGDCSAGSAPSAHHNFNPRPPRGGRPAELFHSTANEVFQSTPSARRATPPTAERESIMLISIHTLREEGDCDHGCAAASVWRFQSTPSARRATGRSRAEAVRGHISIHALREEGDNKSRCQCTKHRKFQSTPSARRATHCRLLFTLIFTNFNPRPPRGGRLCTAFVSCPAGSFQSTPSARRATAGQRRSGAAGHDFNPRPPRGERRCCSNRRRQ